LNIGHAAAASGISAKMIRYYESIGLVPEIGRTASGYREYDDGAIQRLRYIRRARDLGFSLERVSELLALWSNRGRHSADVKVLALAHISELEARARDLAAMIKTLRSLARSCGGDKRPDCPIIEELGSSSPARQRSKKIRRNNGQRAPT
jgi:MerR family copper efflux transcriptional regulator